MTPTLENDSARLTQEVEDLRAAVAELQQRLLQAQKLASVGTLASSITHEFNNILTTVINYAKMGVRHKDAATRDKAFDKILAAGQRASKITTGLLSYARGKGDRRESITLNRLVEDVLVLVEKDLQMHRVRLQLEMQAEPLVLVNPSQVQQVILNLIINARQAMEGGGTLSIMVRQNDKAGMGEVAVRDTGCGIPADRLPHIFETFYSTKVADAQGQGGSGLGLALCKEVVEAHQGRLRVESVVGRGTTFTLKFPLAAASTAPALQSAASKAG